MSPGHLVADPQLPWTSIYLSGCQSPRTPEPPLPRGPTLCFEPSVPAFRFREAVTLDLPAGRPHPLRGLTVEGPNALSHCILLGSVTRVSFVFLFSAVNLLPLLNTVAFTMVVPCDHFEGHFSIKKKLLRQGNQVTWVSIQTRSLNDGVTGQITSL